MMSPERIVFHYVAYKGHAKILLEKALAAHLLPEILNQKDTHRITVVETCSVAPCAAQEEICPPPLFWKCVKKWIG